MQYFIGTQLHLGEKDVEQQKNGRERARLRVWEDLLIPTKSGLGPDLDHQVRRDSEGCSFYLSINLDLTELIPSADMLGIGVPESVGAKSYLLELHQQLIFPLNTK